MLAQRILITGATGLIGRRLTARLLEQGATIVILTRDPFKAQHTLGDKVTYLNSLTPLHSLDDFDAVINLAGEPIADKRWSAEQKRKLCDSRWNMTEQISQRIQAGVNPPKTLISGSAIGYYGDKGDEILTEETAAHPEFTYELCAHWEALAYAAQSDKTRVCTLRTGIVLASQGGALSKLLPVFRLGLGGKLGSGQQYMSWIHVDDMVSGIIHLLKTPEISGPVNMVSPNPVTNSEFTLQLAKSLHRPALFFVPEIVLKTALGEMSCVLLDSQRALPEKLLHSKFVFRYEQLNLAFNAIIHGN